MQLVFNDVDGLLQGRLNLAVTATRHPEGDIIGIYRVCDFREGAEAFGHSNHD